MDFRVNGVERVCPLLDKEKGYDFNWVASEEPIECFDEDCNEKKSGIPEKERSGQIIYQ